MSRLALERAGRIADGWVAQFSMDDLDEKVITSGLATMRKAAGERREFRVVARVTGADRRTAELAGRLAAVAAAGATDLVIDVDWSSEDGAARALETLRAAVA